MTEPLYLEAEASDIEPALFDTAAVLEMQTDQGRIAVHMQRHVFVALFERMRIALGPEVPHVRTPSAS
jgi:hypothetical protein